MLVSAVLAAAVIAQAAYIVKTRRQMDTLYDQVQQLAAESASDGEPLPAAAERRRSPSPSAGGAPSPRLPLPRFSPPPPTFASSGGTPGAVPLPPALDNPEARDQLRQFVAAELQRERDEQRDRMRQRWEEDQQRRMDSVVKALGLNPDEGKRLTEVMTASQTARRELREKIQSGDVARADIARQMASLREKTDQDLKQVLGDDRMQKFQELQRQDRGGGGGGGWGGGRGRGPGGGAPPGPGGARPQAQGAP
jgi:hypothetical protein